MDYAVKKQIKHLCSYISDKSAVLQHVNREHNLRLTLRDIEEAATTRHRARRTDLEAMIPSPLIVTHKRKGYDDLALACLNTMRPDHSALIKSFGWIG
jgi:hypothetical protein